jgi:hypothetical protein
MGTWRRELMKRRKKSVGFRKRRTREHVIADLSFHHLAYLVVECGFTIEGTRSDYGYDGSIWTFDHSGHIENSNLYFQLKATDNIRRSADRSKVLFSVSKKDVNLWQDEFVPVYLIVFDCKHAVAYWVYFQKYLQVKNLRASDITGNTLTIEIDERAVVDGKAIRSWRTDKQKVLAKIEKMSHA